MHVNAMYNTCNIDGEVPREVFTHFNCERCAPLTIVNN